MAHRPHHGASIEGALGLAEKSAPPPAEGGPDRSDVRSAADSSVLHWHILGGPARCAKDHLEPLVRSRLRGRFVPWHITLYQYDQALCCLIATTRGSLWLQDIWR